MRNLSLSCAAALALSLSGLGCSGTSTRGPGVNTAGQEGPITPAPVSSDAFATVVHQLLREGEPSSERLPMLAGAVRRQLVHARERFTPGHEDRGTASVVGALYLVRRGEGRSEMIGEAGEEALKKALVRINARGDEGQAQALMSMRAAVLPTGAAGRADLDEHLASLGRWMKETRTGGPMQRLYAEQRAAVSRAMLDSTEATLGTAAAAVSGWVDRAIEYNIEFRQTGQRPEREEAIEASRALETGGITMAALYLRHGDARAGLEAVERSGARRVIRPIFFERLRAAASDDGPRAWQALLASLLMREHREREDSFDLDEAAYQAAVWGVAVESYRREPTHLGTAMALASSLVALGMSEVAPMVLADAAGDKPTPDALSGSIELILGALVRDADAGDFGATRRTFRGAGPLLAAAERAELEPRVDPGASKARFVMASIEVRSGNLAAARPLLSAAVGAKPTASGFNMLAMLERQAGHSEVALGYVQRALAAPNAKHAPTDVAEAHLTAFEIHRDAGSADKAKGSLDAALATVMMARQLGGNAAGRSRAERLLGRVLDGYGDAKGAVRALERAMQLVANDRGMLGATVLDAVGRALIRRDVSAARTALKRGLEGAVDEEDLIYGGLWVLMLERELKIPTDGTAERALRVGSSRVSWTGKLAAWAAGKLSDDDLGTAAQNPAQKVEAAFYTALAKRIAGDPAADARLRDVAMAPVIDLVEVQIAREMVAPRMRTEVPHNVAIP